MNSIRSAVAWVFSAVSAPNKIGGHPHSQPRAIATALVSVGMVLASTGCKQTYDEYFRKLPPAPIVEPPLEIQFSQSTQSLPENLASLAAGGSRVLIQLNRASNEPVTVSWVISGTASTSDSTMLPGTITFAPGELEKSVTFDVLDDALVEGNETVVLTLGQLQGAGYGSRNRHTVTIVDNDVPPVPPKVQFASASSSVTEGTHATATKDVDIEVTLDRVSDSTVSVDYEISGTASQPGDHLLTAGSVSFSPGSVSRFIKLKIVQDSAVESSETVILTLKNESGATLGTTRVHTATVLDDDVAPIAPPTVQFVLASQSITEGTNSTSTKDVDIEVKLSTASAASVTVDYEVGGSASYPSDHQLQPGTVTFSPGTISKMIRLKIVQDSAVESGETVILTLRNPSQASLGSTQIHTLTLVDDDVMPPVVPTVQFSSASQLVNEGTSPPGSGALTTDVSIAVTLSAATTSTVSINYAVSGTAAYTADHQLQAGTVTFNPGVTSRTITLKVVQDSLFEPNETVILELQSPNQATLGATKIHTVTIDDDDLPTVQFKNDSQGVAEGTSSSGTKDVDIEVTLSAASSTSVSVGYSVGGTATYSDDHQLQGGTLTFAPGTLSKMITLKIVQDSTVEPNETVVLTLQNPNQAAIGTPATHTLTINNDDASPPPPPTNQSITVGQTTTTAKVDLAILIDNSGSMASMIPAVREALIAPSGIVHQLRHANLRIAVQSFGDINGIAKHPNDFGGYYVGAHNVATLTANPSILPRDSGGTRMYSMLGTTAYTNAFLINPTYEAQSDPRVYEPTNAEQFGKMLAYISGIQPSVQAQEENGLCYALQAYQMIQSTTNSSQSAALRARLRNNGVNGASQDVFRGDADALVAVIISDEGISPTAMQSCSRMQNPPTAYPANCGCQIPGYCASYGTPITDYACPSDTDPNKRCPYNPPYVPCNQWVSAVVSDQATGSSCPLPAGTCTGNKQPYHQAGYNNLSPTGYFYGGTSGAPNHLPPSPAGYKQAFQEFKNLHSPSREFKINFVGMTGAGNCATMGSGQSVGTPYMEMATLTGGTSTCLKGPGGTANIGPAFDNVAQNIQETILRYPLASSSAITQVTKRANATSPEVAFTGYSRQATTSNPPAASGWDIVLDAAQIAPGNIITVYFAP